MNRDEERQFWRFVERRQRAWWRKEVKKRPPPWSKDPIIQEAHFTNMMRELDPGTRYATELHGSLAQEEDAAFWLLAYRYMGSNWRAWEHIGLIRRITKPKPAKYDPVWMAELLRLMSPQFGNAYLVYPMTNEQTGKDKAQLVSEGFADVAQAWPAVWAKIKAISPGHHEGGKETHKLIRSARTGIGPFTAYQTLIDYCMLGMVPEWRNDFAVAGPGTSRGASIVWGEPLPARAVVGACWALWEAQNDRLQLDKPHWGGRTPYLSDYTNMLCEYQKYVRVRDTGRITRRYEKNVLL